MIRTGVTFYFEFRNNALRIEYFGDARPELEANLEAVVGRRHARGARYKALGKDNESRCEIIFEIEPSEYPAIKERLEAIQ
jgi:hypothetical protein